MYQKLMVPLDGSELAECVLPHVEAIARGCGATDVIFVRVAEPVRILTDYDTGFSAEDWKRMEAENKAAAESYLKQLVNRVRYDGVNLQAKVIEGRVADSLAGYAEKNDIGLIIIATHGRSGMSRWVLGSVADRVLRSACVPILMVRAPGCIPGI